MLGWIIQPLGSIVAKASWLDWTILVGSLGILFYWLTTWTHDHFCSRGMPYARPVPLLGCMTPMIFGRKSLVDFTIDLYKEFEGHQAFGVFQFLKPIVYIRDPELLKLVTVKYFDHFVDHQQLSSEKLDPMSSRNLFSLKGQEWRDMRATLSPAFTSSKMRGIFKLIDHCGQRMTTFIGSKFKANNDDVYEVEMKEFFTRFANDVIATSAFGIDCDSLRQPENEFYRMGRELTNFKGIKVLIVLGYMFIPKMMEILKISIDSTKVRNFFHNIVHDTIGERKKKGIFRPDMLQLLIQAQEGQIRTEAEDELENITNAKIKRLTDVDVTAQAVIFFFAGFDTVSTTMSFCAYALARHPEIQERVQQEVDEVVEKHGGRLSYEAVQELKYMDMFISEVQRLYSAVPSTDRVCTKDFIIPAQGNVPAYTVRKGDVIWIPFSALHRDPQHWDDPETFDPERFSEENKQKIKPFTYMPFGIGPRICIGSRFALMEVKVALTHILWHFKFQQTQKTPKKVEFNINDFNNGMKGDFWVGIVPRTQ